MKNIGLIFIVLLLVSADNHLPLKILKPKIFMWDISDKAKNEYETNRDVDDIREFFHQTEGIGCSWYCGGTIDTGYCTTQLAPNKTITYGAENIHDFDAGTAWVEGAKGYGIGEKMTLRFPPGNPPVTEVKVYNGYMKSEKTWNENSRVRTLKMYVNNKPYALLQLEDIIGGQRFLTDTFKAEKTKPLLYTFEIYDVYPGTQFDETAISEINFAGTGVH